MLKPIQRTNLSNKVFEQLRDNILGNKYMPGEKLPSERELVDILKVNRGAIREALKKLEQARLVEIRQGHGVVVLDFHINAGFDLIGNMLMPAGQLNIVAIRSIVEFRSIIGPEITRYACRRIQEPELELIKNIVEKIEACKEDEIESYQDLDFQLHYTLARASENLAFIFILNSIREIYFAHKEFFRILFESRIKSREVYRKIYNALRNHDEELSVKLVSDWIEEGNRVFWEYYQK